MKEIPVKKALMIAYMFPPAGGIGIAGAQRVLKFSKYLPHYGWKPVILTVKPSFYEPYLLMDHSLNEKLPSDLAIVRSSIFRGLTWILKVKKSVFSMLTRKKNTPIQSHYENKSPHSAKNGLGEKKSRYQSFKDTITDLFEIPDEEMGWIVPGVCEGWRTIKNKKIDLIYATGRPWTAFLIGSLLKSMTGRPLVVDFRDPWMTNPFRIAYSPLKNHMEVWMEQHIIKNADFVIANTPELRDEFIKRFPGQSREKFVVVLNGFDPDDFGRPIMHREKEDTKKFIIVHTGFLYGRRDPKNVLQALRSLLDSGIIKENKIKMAFIGAIDLDYDLASFIKEETLENVVELLPHQPYRNTLEWLHQADGLLLLQPGTATQIPSKLFEYIGVGAPILAICPRGSATQTLIDSEGLGVVVDSEDQHEIEKGVAVLFKSWQEHLVDKSKLDANRKKFDVKHNTSQLAKLFSRVCSSPED